MKRRWRLWLCLALAFIVGVLFLLPAVHWRVIGWVRGEAFYEGRPTSYWRGQAATYTAGVELPEEEWRPIPVTTPRREWLAFNPDRPAWDQWLEKRGIRVPYSESPQLYGADAKALPVLLELLKSDDPRERGVASQHLANLGNAARPAVPLLLQAIETAESDEDREQIKADLLKIAPDAAAKAGVQ